MKITSEGLGKLLRGLDGAQVDNLGGIFTELNEEKAEAVAEALPGLQSLRRMDFSGSWDISAEAWEKLILGLSPGSCQELILSKSRLSDAKARAIANGLSKLWSLQHLDLSWNREVTGRGWHDLLSALHGSQIVGLDFCHCQLNDAKATLIAEVLPYLRKTLTKEGLLIDGNYQLSEEAQDLITQALTGAPPTGTETYISKVDSSQWLTPGGYSGTPSPWTGTPSPWTAPRAPPSSTDHTASPAPASEDDLMPKLADDESDEPEYPSARGLRKD
jgi:hypothetical protein